VADVYDALISQRVYKPALPHEQAVAAIRAGRGTHFDPDVVDAFLALVDTFQAIATRFADQPHALQVAEERIRNALSDQAALPS
jgi:putative two-component system response regulator